MESSTARCPQCGAAIRPSARFCVTCGIKLPENTPASGAGLAASGWTAREEPASQVTDPVLAMPAPQLDPPGESETEDAAAVTDSAAPVQEADSDRSQPIDPRSWLNWPELSTELDTSAESHGELEIQGEIVDLDREPPENASAATSDEPMTEAAGELPGNAANVVDEIVEAVAVEAAASGPIAAQSNEDELPPPDDEVEPVISGNASPLDEAAFEELN